MSFVTTIRDYVETLNSVSEALDQNLTLPMFVSQTALYGLQTLKTSVLYILSFQWIRDFSLLPIVLPQVSAAILRETFVLENPSTVFFDFLEIPDLHQNTFLLGFFNSFFLALPFSVLHLISIRRLIIQGIPAAVWSLGGYLGGQILFITCTVFGVRSVLIPWLTLEPLNYLLGVILLFRIVYAMRKESLVKLQGWSLGSSEKYKEFLFTSFLLAWCEQTSIFQYLGNLTLSSNVTLLETFSTTSSVSSGFTHFFYILGLSFGAVFFTGCWGVFFLKLKEAVVIYTPLTLSSFMQTLNKTTFVLAVTLSLTSLPFYGFEYILTGPLGFISQDSVFTGISPFDPIRPKEYEKGTFGGFETGSKYLHFDTAPFDRGEYLMGPQVDAPLSFEELNAYGDFEFKWINRIDTNNRLIYKRRGVTISRTIQNFLLKYGIIETKTKSPGPKFIQYESNHLFAKTPSFTEKDSVFEGEVANSFAIIKRFLVNGSLSYQEYDPNLVYQQLSLKTFPNDFLRNFITRDRNVEQMLRTNFYSNPLYQNLLGFRIDHFLVTKQPNQFRLTSAQEGDLFTKRLMMESYYDSLRHYARLPYSDTLFWECFDGTKSFSSKVYNQQFKGTLRSVRRLFSVTLNNDENPEKSTKTVLKFDQPLYDFSENGSFSAYHEELDGQGNQTDNEFQTLPFMVNKPLYAGWDEPTRKFMITNKFLPRNWAGYKVKVDPHSSKQFAKGLQKQTQKIQFTAWPLSLDQVSTSTTQSKIPYMTLFQPADPELLKKLVPEVPADKKAPSDFKWTSLPANVKRFEIQMSQPNVRDPKLDFYPSLAPKRGGFVWPGNSELESLELKEIGRTIFNFLKLK